MLLLLGVVPTDATDAGHSEAADNRMEELEDAVDAEGDTTDGDDAETGDVALAAEGDDADADGLLLLIFELKLETREETRPLELVMVGRGETDEEEEEEETIVEAVEETRPAAEEDEDDDDDEEDAAVGMTTRGMTLLLALICSIAALILIMICPADGLITGS